MCGIAGIVHFDGQFAGKTGGDPDRRKSRAAEIKRMTDRIAYRGPDAEGAWISPDGTTGLGHRRLSILDLSAAGNQPMLFAEGRYAITFNGEIYNYVELRAGLEKRGYRFRTSTDTEVLLALYADKKDELLPELDGMFAFAIRDNTERTLFCARDRFGEKPFYYARDPKRFAFASEIKCLFEAGFGKHPREDRLYAYLAHNVAEDPFDLSSTFYDGILQLEPGHCLKVAQDGSLAKRRYWRLKTEEELGPPPSFEVACQKYYELFETSIKRRLRSDVPVGTSLSGGLDSSSIAVMLDHLKGGEGPGFNTFSARMPDPKKDEGRHIQEVLAKIKAQPHYVWLSPDKSAEDFDTTFYHNEAPLLWSDVISHRQVMRLAKDNGTPVLIDGQGPDEMLAGYPDSYLTYFRELYIDDPDRLAGEIKGLREVRGTQFKTDRRFKLEARFPGTLSKLGALARRLRNTGALKDLAPGRISRHRHDPLPFPRFNRLNDSLRYATQRRGLGYLLQMCDRNSMEFAVEVRLPFLFHELAEFSMSLPANYKIRDGWSKFILRKSMEPLLPPAIAWRRDKVGFGSPQDEWLDQPPFRDRVEQAVALLQREGWITEPLGHKSWQYLSAAKILQNDL